MLAGAQKEIQTASTGSQNTIIARAGGNQHIINNSTINIYSTEAERIGLFTALKSFAPSTQQGVTWGSGDTHAARDPLEDYLHGQVDQIGELLKEGRAKTALKLLEQLLRSLPATASNHVIYRVKASIGHAHMRLGDEKEGAHWLIRAYEDYPTDPKAIANRVLAHLLLNENEEAVKLGREALKHDPENELAAFYLIQATARLPAEPDPLKCIPAALWERPDIVLGQLIFKRVRADASWVHDAQRARRRFAEDKRIQVLAAEADVTSIVGSGDSAHSYVQPAEKRDVLQRAGQLLTEEWEAAITGEQTVSMEHTFIAWAAMVAWKLTRQQGKALIIARQLVDAEPSAPGPLLTAAQILSHAGDKEYFAKAIALAPDPPELKFLKAVQLVDEGDWDNAATILKETDIPDDEREIADAIIRLAPFRDPACTVTETEMRGVMPDPEGDPRALIAFARVARYRGFVELAAEAYTNARRGISTTSNMAIRLMVAGYAADSNDAAAVIELLQGYIPVDEPSNELLWLATAHAVQRPRRPANAEFFELLPASIRRLPAYAKCHSAVVLELGSHAEALSILKSLRETDTKDAYVILLLAEAHARLGQEAELKRLADEIDPTYLEGRAEHRLAVAQFLSQHDRTQEALELGYSILLANQENPRVALGYAGLFLLDPGKPIVDAPETVQNGTAVVLRDENDVTSSLLIDDGEGFWGVEARSASAEDVKGLIGQKKGYRFPLPRRFQTNEFREIVEIKSKYLHVFHVVMDQFEVRFPGHGGIWQIRTQGDDVRPILDAVRDLEERDRLTARRYIDEKWPLAFVARMLGRDVLSFAAYLRHLGHAVFTCDGNPEERNAAVALVYQNQSRGATIDFYTAVVAAQIRALPVLKNWFGKIYVPSSSLALLDRLIANESKILGRESLSITWTGSGYVRHIRTEKEINARIAALKDAKEQIVSNAIVEKELLPDDVPETIANIAEKLGGDAFEGIYLARKKGMIFVCDDLPLRLFANQLGGVESTWIQPILLAARDAGKLDGGVYSKLLAGLAGNGHYHVSIGSDDLEHALKGEGENTFYDFMALARCLGGKTADMRSHVGVTVRFLLSLWGQYEREYPQCEMATSIVLESLTRDRQADWAEAVGYIAAAAWHYPKLVSYIVGWLRGHFLPIAPVNAAFRRYKDAFDRQIALTLLPRVLKIKCFSSPMALESIRRKS